jgi:cohesin loading factor subunit SCC2
VSVRRRVINLLKAFYSVTEDNSCMIDIATRLVLRILDEDETVKDIASRSIEELWFTPSLPSAMKNRAHTGTSKPHDKTALITKVSVIMGTAANFKDRQSPLEDVLHKIIAGKEGPQRMSLHARYEEICQALIEGLVDASDLPGFVSRMCCLVANIPMFSFRPSRIASGRSIF